MMQTLDLCRKTSGKIWHRKLAVSDNGLVISIHNSIYSNISLPTRSVRFLHTDFDQSDDRFIASDHHGNIFLFDLSRNRFSLIQRTGAACTALSFKLRRKTEILVAMSDYSMKCYDTESKELVAWMKGHKSNIHEISLHDTGRYALTTSHDATYLWDLNTFQRKRNLNRKEGIDIVSVTFIPLSKTIMTCFKDDSIFAWDSELLGYKYQLPVPVGSPTPQYRTFAATRDGRRFVGGGKSRFLHIWTLDNRKLQRVIELPDKVTSVTQLHFLPDTFDDSNDMLSVLCQDGIMRFIHISTCKLLFDIGSADARINNASVSQNGRYIAATMDAGHVNLYDIHALSDRFNQPPAPLVKVLETQQEANQTVSSRSCDKSDATRVSESRDSASHDSTPRDMVNGLNLKKLKSILKGYGEYPEKYRLFIWRTLLKVPENHTAYAALLDKGIHPVYAKIHETYPIKSRKLLRILQRVLSVLAHWAPIFSETDYLPSFVFPFVKLFQNNHLVCFEVVSSILMNWCSHWFEFFPNPPINMLSMVENIISHHDNQLLRHLVKYGITSQIYAWPLLQTLFSEVLTKEEWLTVWDHVFSHHPSFLLMCVAAYVISARAPLLHCIEVDDFKFFFRHRNSLDIKRVIKEAYRLDEVTPDPIHPRLLLNGYTSLTYDTYPIFNKYPKFIVDYQIQERERIREEELDYLKFKQAAMDLEEQCLQTQTEEAAWYRQQRQLADAEEKRRHLIAEEEERVKKQRSQLITMQKEMKIKELQLLEESRKKFQDFTANQRLAEIQRLEDEATRKETERLRDGYEAQKWADINNLDSQIHKSKLEQSMFATHEDESRRTRNSDELSRRDDEINTKLQLKLRQLDEERQDCMKKLLNNDLRRQEQSTRPRDSQEGDTESRSNSIPHTIRTKVETTPSANCDNQLYINDSSSTSPTSIHLSLDRGRSDFDERSARLLDDVRQLRYRLAKEGRERALNFCR